MPDFVSIDKYLSLICSLMIDQFNLRYEGFELDDLRKEANERYVERDWVYRIGEPFKELAYYEVPDEGSGQSHHDIGIPSKDFLIEVKYMKNWNSALKHRSARKSWKPYEKDLLWLAKELEAGHKGKRAVVFVWCNCVDYLGQILQLGNGRGAKNPVAKERLPYFPYLMSKTKDAQVMYTKDLEYNYTKRFPCQIDLNTIGWGNIGMDCLFLGKAKDKLHIAIYY